MTPNGDPAAIIAFVRARNAEDKTIARAALIRPEARWFAVLDINKTFGLLVEAANERDANFSADRYPLAGDENGPDPDGRAWQIHAARWNPAVILARCDEVERLVELHGSMITDYLGDSACEECSYMDREEGLIGEWPCAVIRHLAAMKRYRPDGSQHPEWREEWAS